MRLEPRITSVIIGILSIIVFVIPPIIAAIFTEVDIVTEELKISPINIYIAYGLQVVCGIFVTVALIQYVVKARIIESAKFRENTRNSPPTVLIFSLFYTLVYTLVLVPLSLLLGLAPAIIAIMSVSTLVYMIDDLRRVGLAVVYYFLTPLGYTLLVNMVVPYEFDFYAWLIWGNPWVPSIESNIGIIYGILTLYGILAIVLAGKLQEFALKLIGLRKKTA